MFIFSFGPSPIGIEVVSAIFIYGGQDHVFWRTPVYAKLQILKSYSLTIYYGLSPGVRKIYLADACRGLFYLDSTEGLV